ncbi:MAG: branched-chain amino acid ABC transporter permease [Thermoprotei archaeon]|nr:MAG: branched-chain amino acid ABC transporter permease [Thermoprotei archaeon]
MISLLLILIMDIITYISLYLIVTLSLNLQQGYTGIPNLGLVLYVAGGAYVVGALPGRLAMYFYGLKDLDFVNDNPLVIALINQRLQRDPLVSIALFISTILIALIVGAFLGFVSSYPAIRLKAEYLMMTLISMGEAMRIIGYNYSPLVGGTLGVSVPDFFAWCGNFRSLVLLGVIILAAFFTFIVCETIVNSPFGRLMKAVRESEITVESVGRDVIKVKMQVLMLGGALASLAGALYATYSSAVVAQSYNRGDWTFWPWLMMMVGGMGNNRGALIGTIAVVIARRLIIIYKHLIALPFINPIWLEPMLLGALLLIIMTYKPEGLLPERPTRLPKELRLLLKKLVGDKIGE